ncbi:hypothetical protein ABPG74_017658, partial [Tetrahymena malaccensis]
MKKWLMFVIFMKQLILLNSQQCDRQGQFFDFINKKCLNCYNACLLCYGPNQNQCTQCNKDYYFTPQSSSCIQKCEVNMQTDNDKQLCIKCQIFGCQQCDQNNNCTQCFENMELKSDGLCYQKLGTCNNKQLYDYRSNECVYSCQKNTIENYQQKVCENIIDCNFIDEYSSYKVKDNIQQVFLSSNEKIFIVQDYCKVSIANFNLQISQQFQLLPTQEFTSQQQTINQYINLFKDSIYCQSNLNVILYDVITEQSIKFPLFDSFQFTQIVSYFKIYKIFVFYQSIDQQLIIYSAESRNQVKLNAPLRNIAAYIISNKFQIICALSTRIVQE